MVWPFTPGKKTEEPAKLGSDVATGAGAHGSGAMAGGATVLAPKPSEILSDPTPAKKPAGRLYNPYEGLYTPTAVDAAASKRSFVLHNSPQFLFPEEAIVNRRSWSENLTYCTGLGWVLGSTAGVARGTYLFVAAPPEGAEGGKLKFNRWLNEASRGGRRFGNSLGTIGLLYAGLETAVSNARGGDDDAFNPVIAGFGAGALYNAAAGPRTAAIAAATGGIVASGLLLAWHAAKRVMAPAREARGGIRMPAFP